ncbi:uncharacterized protein PV06_02849 [Exophiala oligosperma]|uniref:Uncharacterized protein n=1 Tax=Exophiala oligosperma TaxID=215243 RepID=A0A0D2DX93_9EURO|nr:uncharacterized protein PV06_02849 [Exophiala oligosperma]KIW47265.1 hypothetical protein PV06_02849 [Exophiala oligosperma]
MKVVIEPHNPDWATTFLKIREQLRHTLKDVSIVSIEHVGSTSIPMLKAKPVLDVDIIVHPPALEVTRRALAEAHYTDCGEMNVPGRFAFRQPGNARFDAAHGPGRNGELRYNTYVMIEGCTALRNHLDMKRVLLENPDLREEYSRVKTEMQKRDFENIGHYVSGKTEILCKILRTAGWTDEDLRPVVKVNK